MGDPELRNQIKPIFVLGLQKTRYHGGEVEAVEEMAFVSNSGIESIGVSVGAWGVYKESLGKFIGIAKDADGSDAPIAVANVIRELSSTMASEHSGLRVRDNRKYVAIGVGALGSQVAMNLARSGSGDWTLIDNDVFLPHNAVRHVLVGRFAIGHNKADCVATYMNSITPSRKAACSIPSNYLKAGEAQEQVKDAVDSADLVLDMSASVAV